MRLRRARKTRPTCPECGGKHLGRIAPVAVAQPIEAVGVTHLHCEECGHRFHELLTAKLRKSLPAASTPQTSEGVIATLRQTLTTMLFG